MNRRLFALVGFFLAVLLEPAHANLNKSNAPTNYVIIGAFSVKKNAMRFTTKANKHVENLPGNAKFEFNVNRSLFYVYVFVTPDHQKALDEATCLRRETEYKDAWVYNGSFTNEPVEEAPNVDINPETKQPMDQVVQNDNPVVQQTEPVQETQTQNNYVQVPDGAADTNMPDSGEESQRFVFKLFRAQDSAPVSGDVAVVDAQRSRKLGSYKANEPVNVPLLSGPSKKLGLTTDVFGYRKVQREINLNEKLDDDITVAEDKTIEVPFELVRLQKGDIAIMYNVYFFKDAAIMRPESRYEVNSLLEMLQENPKYKIKIHGHTNGGAAGKIIELGPSKNYFSLTGAKEGSGSAKKLSEERAQVIRQYLIDSGIDAARMQIKAWGGKKPIHDKHSNRAQENVRVEIEILEN